MDFIFGLALGAYLMPAIIDGTAIYIADRKADDEPTQLESITTALMGGLLWPMGQVRAEPMD